MALTLKGTKRSQETKLLVACFENANGQSVTMKESALRKKISKDRKKGMDVSAMQRTLNTMYRVNGSSPS